MDQKLDFMSVNKIECVEVKEDYAKCIVRVNEASMNYYGYVHGGLYFGLADSTAGYTASSRGDNYVTLNANINYMSGIQTGTITCIGTVLSRTRKTCVVDIKIYDDNEVLCDTGTFTMYHIN